MILIVAPFAGSSPAVGDHLGIPFNETFSKAQFPYARVLEHCTSWRRPEGLGDVWSSVSFRGACQQHDRCYHTIGAKWGECNRRYLSNLRAACERDLKKTRLEKGDIGEPDAEALSLCFNIASLYHAMVQKPVVIKKFRLAQTAQRAYLDYVVEIIKKKYESAKGDPPSNKVLETALGHLAQGHELDELVRIWQGMESIGYEIVQ